MINVTQAFLPPIDEYLGLLERAWELKWLTNRGELVRDLESKLTDRLGIKNLLTVSNGTIALQIAIKALNISGEIITTPFSYVATVSSIVWENCTPVFADIDEESLTIDVTKIEDAITDKTSAILATHVYGNPCDVESIKQIADKHDLKVIYDAAHCYSVKYRGESILNWGDISTLSFHATKLFHTGEGGGIICNDAESVHSVFYSHNFGHDGPDRFFGLGVNAKLSELNAAMGLAVLPYIDDIISKRKQIFAQYDSILGSTSLRKPAIRQGAEINYSYYPVIFPSDEQLLKAQLSLNDAQIFPRRYFYPSLNLLPYVEYKPMPAAESVSKTVLCLPLYYELTESEVEKIATLIVGAMN